MTTTRMTITSQETTHGAWPLLYRPGKWIFSLQNHLFHLTAPLQTLSSNNTFLQPTAWPTFVTRSLFVQLYARGHGFYSEKGWAPVLPSLPTCPGALFALTPNRCVLSTPATQLQRKGFISNKLCVCIAPGIKSRWTVTDRMRSVNAWLDIVWSR